MRKKRNPWAEGSIAQIYEMFFKPIMLNHCPEEQNPKDFLEDLFNTDHRTITVWRAEKAFRMPGLLYTTPLFKTQGVGWRQVKRGDTLYIREDSRTPDDIDVEFFAGQGEKDQVFCLTAIERIQISHNIKKLVD